MHVSLEHCRAAGLFPSISHSFPACKSPSSTHPFSPSAPSPATSTQPPTTCFFLVSKANFFLHTPTHTPHPFYLQVDGLQRVSSTDDYLRSATTCRPFLLNWSPIFFRQRMSYQILTVNYFYRASAWLSSWLRFSPNDQHSLRSQWQQNQACSAWCWQVTECFTPIITPKHWQRSAQWLQTHYCPEQASATQLSLLMQELRTK